MASTTFGKIRIPWERFENIMEDKFEAARKLGATEEMLEEVKNELFAKYDSGEYDISLDVIFGSDE